MKGSKSYLKDLDFVRVLACVMVLLYHMNIVKGGFLFVCTFFVLSGYLSASSLLHKKEISLKKYYLSRLKKIYFPLIIVTFITVFVVSFINDYNWFNLKSETTSIIFGYNNFWQLDANLDYFARHISSPFMHLWYMAILLQFELFFPLFFKLMQKMKDKISKYVPCAITFLLAISSTMYFFVRSLDNNIMFNYYHTFTRMFSLCLGIYLAFVHYSFPKRLSGLSQNKKINNILYILLLLISSVMALLISSEAKYYALAMILISFISVGFIEYAFANTLRKERKSDKVLHFVSSISYEIYLVQYPIIFVFQYIELNLFLKGFYIILLTLICAYIINFALNFPKMNKGILRVSLFSFLIVIAFAGFSIYASTENHSKEMQALADKLLQNAALMEEKKQQYAENLKKEEENWHASLKDLEKAEAQLANVITNLPVVGIGDSVMLGAVDALLEKFPNGYYDAAVSRTAWVASSIIKSLSKDNLLGNPVLINLGSNGDCDDTCKHNIMHLLKDRKVFWLNVTNDSQVHFNKTLERFSKLYSNLYIIDWQAFSKGHSEYFVADRIHLTEVGKKAYVNAVYDAIYDAYLQDIQKQKEELNNNFNELQENKVTFIGNSLLINVYEHLTEDFGDAKLITDAKFNFDSIKIALQAEKITSKKIIMLFDKESMLTNDNYNVLANLYPDKEFYLILLDKSEIGNFAENIKVIDFSLEIKKHPEYLLVDQIHLTNDGSQRLSEVLKEYFIIK